MTDDTKMHGEPLMFDRPKKMADPMSATIATTRVQTQAVNQSHNTYRPDIYRVSEGYLT